MVPQPNTANAMKKSHDVREIVEAEKDVVKCDIEKSFKVLHFNGTGQIITNATLISLICCDRLRFKANPGFGVMLAGLFSLL